MTNHAIRKPCQKWKAPKSGSEPAWPGRRSVQAALVAKRRGISKSARIHALPSCRTPPCARLLNAAPAAPPALRRHVMRSQVPGPVLSGEEALRVESQAFWCFARLMDMMESNFSTDCTWVADGCCAVVAIACVPARVCCMCVHVCVRLCLHLRAGAACSVRVGGSSRMTHWRTGRVGSTRHW